MRLRDCKLITNNDQRLVSIGLITFNIRITMIKRFKTTRYVWGSLRADDEKSDLSTEFLIVVVDSVIKKIFYSHYFIVRPEQTWLCLIFASVGGGGVATVFVSVSRSQLWLLCEVFVRKLRRSSSLLFQIIYFHRLLPRRLSNLRIFCKSLMTIVETRNFEIIYVS